MVKVNIHEAKTTLSKLVRQLENGEEIVIARAGVPVAKLVPYVAPTEQRQLGGFEGQIHVADDFDELPADMMAAFADPAL